MSSLVVLFSLASMWAATPPLPQAQTDPCATNPNGPKCVGRWMEPIELCGQDGPIGCNAISAECAQAAPCNTGCENGDEVAHAALIPSGPHAGQILVWTRCDRPTQNPSFGSYVWDPVSQLVTAEAAFPPGAADAFCAGHTWVLDAAGKAKLFVVGGSLTNRAYWFDAETVTWNPGPDPVDLPAGDVNYYPSVVTWGDDATKTSMVAVVGGTKLGADELCPPDLFQKWWSLASPFTSGSWTEHPSANHWYQYPRTLLLSSNVLFSPGHVVTCEDDTPSPYLTTDWGGNPVQILDLATGTHMDLPNVDPNVVFANGFPRGAHQPIRGWNYNNAVVLHTLKGNWTWTADPVAALTRYDLDRVLAFGGGPKLQPHGFSYDGHSVTLELQHAASLPADQWTWREKARAGVGRALGNWVILPTGKVLVVGGALRASIPLATAELFDPAGPTQPGSWRGMHTRLTPSGQSEPIQRVYHSAALLTPGGEVVLMGGAQLPGQPNSMHTLEVYRPPYLYYSGRPSLTNVPATIHYPNGTNPNTFCVLTNAVWIKKAVLIGVGSVTHHFDYGQRYVELMVRGSQCGANNLEILPPVKSSLAPPGYYLLFLIDGFGLPSVGRLVKLDYQRP
jgi:hypothetical protein